MRVVISIILIFCFVNLNAQQDSLLKRHKYCFSLGFHYNYQYYKREPPSDLWTMIDGSRVQENRSTIAINGGFSYLYYKKWFIAKTGIIFHNFKNISEISLDSSLKYFPNENIHYTEINSSANTIMIQLMAGFSYKRIVFFIGNNINIFELQRGKSKFYEVTTQQIFTKRSNLYVDYIFSGHVRNTFIYPTAEFQYLIYKGKFNILSSVNMILTHYLDVGLCLSFTY